MKPQLQAFFDPATFTFSYVIHTGTGSPCAILDSVLDYDPKAGRTSTTSADRLIHYVRQHDLHVEWLLETHAHADHLSASPYLQQQLGGKIAIGAAISTVQATFKHIFNLEPEFQPDGRQFDHLFQDGETFNIGPLHVRALHTPGHTPADMAYQLEEQWVFVGDTLFMPDVGTARCDFPNGNAGYLYDSISRLLALPDDTQLLMCHDYPPEGREPCWHTTVAEQRAHNIHVHTGSNRDTFIAMRNKRDATLAMPTLLLPAVQVNIRAGRLPPAESNGVCYLKIPVNSL